MYASLAASEDIPFLDSQASHLALPLKSSMPGRAVSIKCENSTHLTRNQGVISFCLTGVDVSDGGLLEEGVDLLELLVSRSGLEVLDVFGSFVESLRIGRVNVSLPNCE